jgi:exo-beta-1,3-glucanase (GH17 family)
MKSASILIALASLLGVVSAHVGRNHEMLHKLMKKAQDVSPVDNTNNATCGCITTVSTWYGEATRKTRCPYMNRVMLTRMTTVVQPATTTQLTTTYTSTSYSTVTVYATGNSPNQYTTFPSTGVYTIPATSITLTSTVIVPCPTASSSDIYAPGTYTRPETTMTITETNSVYVCPYTSVSAPTKEAPAPPPTSQAPAPAPAPAPTGEPAPMPPASQAPAAAPAPVSEAPVPAPASPTQAAPPSVAPASSESAKAPSSSSSGSSLISGNGNKWAMTYSPYTAEGGCKEAGAVRSDVSAIKSAGFTAVRLYSTDCSGLQNVGNACKEHGLKLVLGVFIDGKGIDAARPQVTDIISWGQWQMVELIVIGNEALFNKFCDAGALASFIAESKAQFQGAGYSGPCTTTETMNVWQHSGSALCSVIDVLGANIHPFFNPEVSPDQAGSFTAGQVELLGEICPGKEVYNLESGWPHAGQANGKATPGPEYQNTAIMSIMDKVGAKTIFFSFEDDMWKQPGAFGVEQSWGCNKIFS